jgi:hypothetical protein
VTPRAAIASSGLRALIVGAGVCAVTSCLWGRASIVVGGLAIVATLAAAIVECAAGESSSGPRSSAIAVGAFVAAVITVILAIANLTYAEGQDGLPERTVGAMRTLGSIGALPLVVVVLACAPLGVACWHRTERVRRRSGPPPHDELPIVESAAGASLAVSTAAYAAALAIGTLPSEALIAACGALIVAFFFFLLVGLFIVGAAAVSDHWAPGHRRDDDQPTRSAIALPTEEQDFSPPRS